MQHLSGGCASERGGIHVLVRSHELCGQAMTRCASSMEHRLEISFAGPGNKRELG